MGWWHEQKQLSTKRMVQAHTGYKGTNHIELSRLLGEGSEEENAHLFIHTFTTTLDEGRENLSVLRDAVSVLPKIVTKILLYPISSEGPYQD